MMIVIKNCSTIFLLLYRNIKDSPLDSPFDRVADSHFGLNSHLLQRIKVYVIYVINQEGNQDFYMDYKGLLTTRDLIT